MRKVEVAAKAERAASVETGKPKEAVARARCWKGSLLWGLQGTGDCFRCGIASSTFHGESTDNLHHLSKDNLRHYFPWKDMIVAVEAMKYAANPNVTFLLQRL